MTVEETRANILPEDIAIEANEYSDEGMKAEYCHSHIDAIYIMYDWDSYSKRGYWANIKNFMRNLPYADS